MQQNPYAAPTADLDARPASRDQQAWFAVGTRKLLVMSVLTFGLYTIHWFERQYRFQKNVRAESNPNRERNESFTVWNWLLMVLGGGLLVLGVIGSFMPDE